MLIWMSQHKASRQWYCVTECNKHKLIKLIYTWIAPPRFPPRLLYPIIESWHNDIKASRFHARNSLISDNQALRPWRRHSLERPDALSERIAQSSQRQGSKSALKNDNRYWNRISGPVTRRGRAVFNERLRRELRAGRRYWRLAIKFIYALTAFLQCSFISAAAGVASVAHTSPRPDKWLRYNLLAIATALWTLTGYDRFPSFENQQSVIPWFHWSLKDFVVYEYLCFSKVLNITSENFKFSKENYSIIEMVET